MNATAEIFNYETKQKRLKHVKTTALEREIDKITSTINENI